MSFEKGSVSFRIFKSRPGVDLPADAVERLAQDVIPAIDTIPADGGSGWVTGRHLLDRNITGDTVSVAGRLRMTLARAERKIPGALFKTECKQEELAWMEAKGVPFLKRAERLEISKSVRDRLAPTMPLALAGIDVVTTKDGAYATAMSDSNVDFLTMSWKKTMGYDLFPYTPDLVAMMNGVNRNALNPTSFSPVIADEDSEQNLGTEFLTWLWYFSEAKGGVHKDFGYALEGPFTLIHEGAGAHEIVIRKGNPSLASEVKSALMAGKKLSKAKLIVARGDEQWMCSLGGADWSFGSMKLPKGEKLDPVSMFDVRISSIATFIEAFEELYKGFLIIRNDPIQWAEELLEIRRWVADRAVKA